MRCGRQTLLAGSLILVLGLAGCGRPASIGGDKDTFKAVDALYTAVSLRDAKLVDQCEAQLKQLGDSGKLPADAARSLAAIIAETRTGKWEPAQERLATFMEGQRR